MPLSQFQNRFQGNTSAEQVRDDNHPRRRGDSTSQHVHTRRRVFQIQIERHRHKIVFFDDPHHVWNGDCRDQHFTLRREPERFQ